jgi:hypothetical protein
MEYVAFKCDSCGCRIEDASSPLVVRVNAGASPGAAAVLDVTEVPLPRRVRAVLARPSQNLHYCVDCYAWEHGEDLVDVEGAVVVAFADCTTREQLAAAHVKAIAAARHGPRPTSEAVGSVARARTIVE